MDRPANLPAHHLARLKADMGAWSFYQAQPPWYRRTSTWWIISAKQEGTRLRRLSTLIERSARGQPVSPLARKPRSNDHSEVRLTTRWSPSRVLRDRPGRPEVTDGAMLALAARADISR